MSEKLAIHRRFQLNFLDLVCRETKKLEDLVASNRPDGGLMYRTSTKRSTTWTAL